ncbi:MAG: CotH kinase family protein, partial [Verrucomicrobiales bacterium]|nr:CotH kinase family protein [Verrucomicrobiales bacterium]
MKKNLFFGSLILALILIAACGRDSSQSAPGLGATVAQDADKRAKEPAQKAAINSKKKTEKTAGISFSHKRGFYDQPFELALTCDESDADIRYTIDGSAPTKSTGQAYTRAIPIKSTSVVRAAAFKSGFAANVKVHTYIFPKEVVTQSSDGLPPAGWPYEWGQNRVDYGMDPRVVNDPRYRDSLIEGLRSLPSFSLVMNLDDLFQGDRGIYSNAERDGKEAERAGSLELVYPDGTKGFQIDCGVRIRGGFSRMPMNPKHAFRFFFRKQYGEGKLKFPLFGKDAADTFDSVDLRCAQNYSWSLAGDLRGVFLRDQLNRDLQLAMGHPAARGHFYHLYLNGQYWGLYNTCERPEASFAATYFGGDKEDYDVVKPRGGFGRRGEKAPFVTDGNVEAWKHLWTAAKKGVASNEAYFRLQGKNPDGSRNAKYEVLLDPTNLIDYMLVILYGGNFDAPISRFMREQHANNWYGLRHRKGELGFKFFVWDAEHTLLDLNDDRTGPFPAGTAFEDSNPQWLWQQCLENAEFRLLVADR